MKLLYIFPISIMLTLSATAQKTDSNKKLFFLSAGPSIASSGDLKGFHLRLGFQKKVKRWNFGLSQTTSIHDGSHPIFFELGSSGIINNGSIRYTVVGLELSPSVGFSLYSNDLHNFQIGFGAVIRYQSNGDNDSYVLLYPAATGLPVPVMYFTNTTPLRTIAIGPMVHSAYDFSLSYRWTLGANGSFQFDTNGDNFLNYGIRLGYKFQ